MGWSIGNLIDNIVNAVTGGVRAVAGAVRDTVSGIWNTATDLWHRIGLEETAIADALRRWYGHAVAFIGNVFTAIKYVITVLIPKAISTVQRAIMSAVNTLVGQARNFAQGLFNGLKDFAVGLLNGLRHDLDALGKWARDNIGSLLSDLRSLAQKVTHFLTDPAVLVAWLWNALWSYAWQWVQNHEEFVARWLLARAVRGTQRLAGILETLILRIF